MCIAVYYPIEAKEITREVLLRCAVSNKDGFGLMYAENGKLVIEKGFFNPGLFANRIQILRQRKKTLVLHWRLATHGEISLNGSHPHQINENLAFVHNGVIKSFTNKNETRSDTMIFRDDILTKMPEGWLQYEGARELVDDYIGYSKLIFMDNTGKVDIIGERLGVWDEGSWFSVKSINTTRAIQQTAKETNTSRNYNYDGYKTGEYDYNRCGECMVWKKGVEAGICESCLEKMAEKESEKEEKGKEEIDNTEWEILGMAEEIKDYLADTKEYDHELTFAEWRRLNIAIEAGE